MEAEKCNYIIRKQISMRRKSPQISARLRKSPQVSASLRIPPQASAILRKPPQVSASLRKCKSKLVKDPRVRTAAGQLWRGRVRMSVLSQFFLAIGRRTAT